MRRLVPVASVLLLIPLTGCLAKLAIAEIPASSLPRGWSVDEDASQQGSAGWGPISVEFAVRGYEHPGDPVGQVFVMSVPDIPIVDEGQRLREEVQRQLASNGIRETEEGQGSATVAGDAASYRLYSIERSSGSATLAGKAVQMQWVCSGTGNFVGVYGWALTEVEAVLGSVKDTSTWEEIFGTGQAPAGLVAAVDCRP